MYGWLKNECVLETRSMEATFCCLRNGQDMSKGWAVSARKAKSRQVPVHL